MSRSDLQLEIHTVNVGLVRIASYMGCKAVREAHLQLPPCVSRKKRGACAVGDTSGAAAAAASEGLWGSSCFSHEKKVWLPPVLSMAPVSSSILRCVSMHIYSPNSHRCRTRPVAMLLCNRLGLSKRNCTGRGSAAHQMPLHLIYGVISCRETDFTEALTCIGTKQVSIKTFVTCIPKI